MGLDIRWPIGIIFAIYGIVLMIFGLATDPGIFEKSLNVNIDLWWGLAMLVFGLVMGSLALRASRRKPS